MGNLHDKVSVIIPTYNRSKLLIKAVDSIRKQTHKNIEIVIVDDCSSDDTSKVVEKLGGIEIIYIRHEENKGGAEARNTGIEHVSGKYIGFLDSDDEWLPEKLEKQLDVFEKNPEAGVVYAGVKAVDSNLLIKEIVPDCRGDILPNLIEFNCIDTTSSILVKKDLLKQVNGFDASLPSCQDWDLYLRLSQITKFDYVKDSLVLFNQHDGNRISTNMKSVVDGHTLIYRKYRNLAKTQSGHSFQKFMSNIFKTLFKMGITHQNKEVIIASRKMLLHEMQSGSFSFQFLYLYTTTFVNLRVLKFLYATFGKSNQKPVYLEEILSTG